MTSLVNLSVAYDYILALKICKLPEKWNLDGYFQAESIGMQILLNHKRNGYPNLRQQAAAGFTHQQPGIASMRQQPGCLPGPATHQPRYRPPPTHQPGYPSPDIKQPGYPHAAAHQPGYRPPAAQQPGYRPPTSQQPGYRPPASQQPGYRPPASQQPGYRPPASQQPGYRPPASQQPGYRPPASQQPGYRKCDRGTLGNICNSDNIGRCKTKK